jgi:hypothetical protein
VLPPLAEHALAPISSSSCGIGSIINSWAIDSIANPHLNNDLGTIIAFPGETFGLGLVKTVLMSNFNQNHLHRFWFLVVIQSARLR